MGNGSFTGIKRPERSVDHPTPSSAQIKERVELYLYSPSGPSWPVLGWILPLPLHFPLPWQHQREVSWRSTYQSVGGAVGRNCSTRKLM